MGFYRAGSKTWLQSVLLNALLSTDFDTRIWYQRSWKGWTDKEADVSSVSPSSERNYPCILLTWTLPVFLPCIDFWPLFHLSLGKITSLPFRKNYNDCRNLYLRSRLIIGSRKLMWNYYLTNWTWFSVASTLIYFGVSLHSGQNVVASRGQAEWVYNKPR